MNNAYICVAAAARFCFQLKCFSYSHCIFCDHRVGCLVGEPSDRRIRIAGKLRKCVGIHAFKSAVKIRRNVVIGDEAVEAPEGNMVIDIGGGTSEIACISLGGIVCSESINTAGDVFTNDIQSYVRQQHNVRIGERTAEAIKCAIGAAIPKLEEEPEDFTVTGPNMLTALPQSVTLNYNEIAYALEKSLIKLDAALMKVLETMPPELYADIVKNGIYLAGGGALIKGLDRRLTEKTGLPFHIAEDPLRAIARGTGIALKNIDRFSFLMK